MRTALLAMTILGLLALPAAATARMKCGAWQGQAPEEKASAVRGMIDGHLSSNKSQRYTSANRVAMRRCLEANVDRIIDDIDDACSRRDRGSDPVDDTFDRYLLSCVN